MGRMIAQGAQETGFDIACGVDSKPDGALGFPVFDSYSAVDVPVDLVIDFSSAAALPALLAFADNRKLPLLLGATGYSAEDMQRVHDLGKATPVFQSSNMSIGVFVLRQLAAEASRLLPGYDIEIIERHHNKKLDAPSGTALSLYAAVKGPDRQAQHGRKAGMPSGSRRRSACTPCAAAR